VHGFIDEGTTTTPFDMTVLNRLDRFHLAQAVVERVEKLSDMRSDYAGWVRGKLAEHNTYIRAHGEDMPEILNWTWNPE
jgi:xylulose-5-phosphate/fructose-6-phosphate phosphoketolase